MEELDFNELLIAKRHKELVTALKAILDKLTVAPTSGFQDKEIRNTLVNIEKALKTEKESPLALEIERLSEAIQVLKPDPAKSWVFDIQRDSKGFIQSVLVRKNED
jgi:hypothetical protein